MDRVLIARISIEIYYTTTLFLGTTTSQIDVKVVYDTFTTNIMHFQFLELRVSQSIRPVESPVSHYLFS